ncbi:MULTISPECIES: hypothetical protein [Spirulina sp. CCY15215]|uniref:hypothetical protein n=1 Tax=Spirulina sp. CCY15215 TaxID=2767591 RepID=UPI00194FFB5B|nr:hypothetical protein [Spirulina major]
MIIRRWLQRILSVFFLLLLLGCNGGKPPISLAPTGEWVKKAIALQVRQSQELLSENLKVSNPDLKISGISIQKIEPLYMAHLPTFHITGSYNLEIDLPNQKVKQKSNLFDIFLQRQKEGKTWRWLKKEILNSEDKPIWKTYLVRPY